MDQDLKDYLDRRFAAVDQRLADMDQRLAAVDQRFAAVDQRFADMEGKLDAVKTSMFQRLDEMAATLEEGYRDTQTEVLKAVYSMGERVQARVGAQEAVVVSLQQRQASVEARLLEIEKRLNLPPAA